MTAAASRAPEPRVSVVVTCFNQGPWVEQALDSVAAQTEQNIQIIITDDASSDDSRSRIAEWLSRHAVEAQLVTSDSNVGLPAMLNRTLPVLRGRYVVLLNADDWMEPDRIALQAAALDDAPERVGVVYSDLRIVDVDGIPTGEVRRPPVEGEGRVLLQMISSPVLGMPYTMFRRSVLETIGPWDESLDQDDYDFLLRIAQADIGFTYLPGVVGTYRSHGDSMTGDRVGALADGRIRSLSKLLGRDADTNRAIFTRMSELAMAMHAAGYGPDATRRRLWFVMRRHPSKRVGRALIEQYFRLRPGVLSGASLRRALRR